jgi:hypothetical protein
MQKDRSINQAEETKKEHDQQHNREASQDNAPVILEKFKVRYAKPNDIPFIKKTFLYALYNGSLDWHRMNKQDFMREYSRVLDLILTNPEVFVKIAHLPDDEDIIISYSIVQYKELFNILHFVYTKKMWRGQRAHLKLLPEKFDYYTHITKQWLAIMPPNTTYNPFLIGR